MKIIFLGTSEFAALILRTVKEKTGWVIGLVISEPAKPAGREKQPAHSPVAQAAQELNLKLITPKSIKDAGSEIGSINPDIMVVAAYGQMLPRDIFDLPRYKTINAHPSLLPKLRGPSPIQAALIQGLTETGVSLMLIDEQSDHGPVISQETVTIDDDDNYITLESKLADLGGRVIVRDIPKYVAGEPRPQPQNDSLATYTKIIKKEDGRIDWQKMSAEDVYNLWRAFIKWPGVYTFFKNKSDASIRLKLIEIEECVTSDVQHRQPGEVFVDESKGLCVACREGVIKPIKLQPEAGKILGTRDFLSGYRYFIGQKLS